MAAEAGMSLHIRGCWLANGSKRSERQMMRFRTRQEIQRIHNLLLREILERRIITKREARLLQKQSYRQQGGA
jgi:hypothetical protein